jgi:hypothetical protein
MGLLQDIRDGAVDSQSDLNNLLRRCQILSHTLKHQPFREWVEHELNGYPKGAELPPYRIDVGQPYGSSNNGYWKATNVQIPLSLLPEQYQEQVSAIMVICR